MTNDYWVNICLSCAKCKDLFIFTCLNYRKDVKNTDHEYLFQGGCIERHAITTSDMFHFKPRIG